MTVARSARPDSRNRTWKWFWVICVVIAAAGGYGIICYHSPADAPARADNLHSKKQTNDTTVKPQQVARDDVAAANSRVKQNPTPSAKERGRLLASSTAAFTETAPLVSIAGDADTRSRMMQRSDRARQLNSRLKTQIQRLVLERETATDVRKEEIDNAVIVLQRNLEQRERRVLAQSWPLRISTDSK